MQLTPFPFVMARSVEPLRSLLQSQQRGCVTLNSLSVWWKHNLTFMHWIPLPLTTDLIQPLIVESSKMDLKFPHLI